MKKTLNSINRFLFFMISLLAVSNFVSAQEESDKKDNVNIAFKKTDKSNIIGAITILNAEEIKQYNNEYLLSSALLGRVPGLLGTSNNRGIGNFLFVVDGIPRDISMIKMSEVEQVSFLKDINSSILYGNFGATGIILVQTKRGKENSQEISVHAHYGMSFIKDLPSYLSSADYMELYNEARRNDGLTELYDAALIEKYRTGNKYRYPDVDYYSKDFINQYSPSFNVETEFRGGNNVVTYYANAGWRQTRGYLNFGTGKEQRTNRFNIRGNVDVNINSFLKSSVDAMAVLSEGYAPTGNSYWSTVGNFKPNAFTPLLPFDLIDPENQLLIARLNDIDGKYLLGGTQAIRSNPIAIVYSGGLISPHAHRTFSFNQKNDADLSALTEGLSFHTNMSFDFYSTYKQAVRYTYSVYEPVWDDNDFIVDLKQYGIDQRTGEQSVGEANYVRRIGAHASLNYEREFNNTHYVGIDLLGHGAMIKGGLSDIQGDKNLNFGANLNYFYKRKYMINFSGAYVFSAKLPQNNNTIFSPSLGIAWVASSEDFFSSMNNIDYLKFKFTTGSMYSDSGIANHFLYNSRTSNSGAYAWYEGQWSNQGTVSSRGENPYLSFENRKDINIGAESVFFNKQLSVDLNYFSHIYNGQVVRPQTVYPSFYSDFIPYENFDKTKYYGMDLGISFNKEFRGISLLVGTNLLYTTSEILKKDEIFRNDYQYRTGHPFDTRFALVADGLFKDEEDIKNHAVQSFGTVRPGDIKYVDQNNDNVINSEDEVPIGRSQAPFSYSLYFKIDWNNFTLFALGNGRNGAHTYMSGDYYWVDGDKKYSDIVLNRWTENMKTTATYPRLSSMTNSNNFRNSTFWLYKSDFFTIDRVQLSYNVPKVTFAKEFMVYLDGSDLIRFSKYRKIQELNPTGTPPSRSFSLGLKITF